MLAQLPAPRAHQFQVGAEATGLVRVALAAIAKRHAHVIRCCSRVTSGMVADFAYKTGLGRARARSKIERIMPIKPLVTFDATLVYRTLRVIECPLADLTQDGVEVMAIVAGASRTGASISDACWGFWASRHSLGKLVGRAGHSVDVKAVIEEAHNNLLGAPFDTWETAHRARDWAVPAANGAFLCDILTAPDATGDTLVVIRARTWVENNQLGPDQEAMVAAIKFQGVNLHPLGRGILLPPQQRPIAIAVDGFAKLPRSF